MALNSMTLSLFGALIILSPVFQSFTVETIVKVVMSVQQRLYSGCTFILESEKSGGPHITLLFKTLNNAGVTLSVLDAETILNARNRFHCNNPLHVIIHEDNISKLLSNEVLAKSVLPKSRWLLFLEAQSLGDVFAHSDVPLDSELLVVQTSAARHCIEINEIYKVHASGDLLVHPIAFGSAENEIAWTGDGLLARRANLQGLVLKGGVTEFAFGQDVATAVKNGKTVEVAWFFGECWLAMEKSLNFTTELHVPSDGGIGAHDVNGSWKGLVRLVMDEQVHVAVMPIAYSAPRFQVVDYLSVILASKTIVQIRHPDVYMNDRGLITAPFSVAVWLAVATTAVVLILHLSATIYVGRRFGNPTDFHYAVIFNLLGSFCQQGQHCRSNSCACRLVFWVALLYSVVLIASYSATITSFLAVHRTKLPFTSFQELLDDGTYRLEVAAGTSPLTDLQSSKDPLWKGLYKRMIAPHVDRLPQSYGEGIRRLCTWEQYAFMCPDFVPVKDCQVDRLPQAFYGTVASFPIVKGSPYRRILSHKIQMLQENGVLQRLKVLYTTDQYKEEAAFRTVSWDKVSTFFLIIALGCFISAGALLMECTWHFFREKYGTTAW